MNPVLLYTDNASIAREQKFLTDCVPVFQSIYNALSSCGITVTLDDVNNFISWTKNRNGGPNFEQNFVIDRLLDAASYVVNGITITREGMRGIMAIPDVSAVKTALKSVSNLYNQNIEANGVEISLLTIADGIVTKAVNADDTIAARYTYYTKSDASATLANSLQVVCDALNTYNANNQTSIYTGLGVGTTPGVLDTDFKGIAIVANNFVPSLGFIRMFERTGSLNSRD